MKNIHVLSTDKPSRLQLQMNGNFHIENGQTISLRSYQNIYITSDEEIKDGDYYLYLKDNSIQQFIKKHHTKLLALDIQKKIILTTDQDLIKDGVQEIEYSFIEWFVKNPSCEYVKVIDKMRKINVDELRERHRKGLPYIYSEKISYKIIIPKQEVLLQSSIDGEPIWGEPKQETLEEVKKVERTELFNSIYSVVKKIPRKEVEGDVIDAPSCAYELEQLFLKWQQERSYSEEKLLDALQQIATGEIVGEPKNYKDSLYIVKEIAKEAIEEYFKKLKNK